MSTYSCKRYLTSVTHVFLMLVFVVGSSSIVFGKNQQFDVSVGQNMKLDAPSNITGFDYETNNSSDSIWVNEGATDWDAFSNVTGGTTVEFKITPFTNTDPSTDVKRSATIQITSKDGGWGNGSGTEDLGAKTADPTGDTDRTVDLTDISLQTPGNGFGMKPLNGTISVKVWFEHLSEDQVPSGDYYAPEGLYETQVTGTIKASN